MKKTRKIILIFGKTGSGKSTLVKELTKDIDRKIIIDVEREYRQGIIFETYKDFHKYILFNNDVNFEYIIRFENDEDIERLFLLINYISDLTLIVEEAESYISPDVRKSNFNKLINQGRHRAISIIAIARRPVELSRRLRSQVNRIYAFKQSLPEDILLMQKLGFQDLSKLPDFSEHTNKYGFQPGRLNEFYRYVDY